MRTPGTHRLWGLPRAHSPPEVTGRTEVPTVPPLSCSQWGSSSGPWVLPLLTASQARSLV